LKEDEGMAQLVFFPWEIVEFEPKLLESDLSVGMLRKGKQRGMG
jgi:hypothetical protein